MTKRIKGIKVFEKDLSCRGFQYDIGKTYEIDGEPILCKRGFHFHHKAKHILNYYNEKLNEYRYCEVVGYDVIKSDDKCVARKIKIVRELSEKEKITILNNARNNDGWTALS